MFIRKKKNQSGSVSIQIIQKVDGKNELIKSIGSSKNEEEIKLLVNKAQQEIPKILNQGVFGFGYIPRDTEFLTSLRNTSSIKIILIGPDLMLGIFFDFIGFNQVKE